MKPSEPSNSLVQLIWGATLVAVGIAVFFRIPQVMPQLAQMGQSATTTGFIRICFYIMGILLVGGGAKKIIHCLRWNRSSSDTGAPDRDNN
jgi:hypothetical protein